MKKRILSLLLSFVLILSLVPSALAADGGLSNFKKVNDYTAETFTDVEPPAWYAENVQTAYELGLMVGDGNTFNPSGNLTIAESLALACRLHNIYYGGSGEFEQGSPWYQVYVDYAVENGIISLGQYEYTSRAKRSEFAAILYAAFPSDALQPINTVPDGAIPDVASSQPIYALYRAGILTGSDEYGTFYPDSNIERSAVAAIVTRMAATSLRKTVVLQKKPIDTTSGISIKGFESYNTDSKDAFAELKKIIASKGDAVSYGYMYNFYSDKVNNYTVYYSLNYYSEEDQISFAQQLVEAGTVVSQASLFWNEESSYWDGVQLMDLLGSQYYVVYTILPSIYAGYGTFTDRTQKIPNGATLEDWMHTFTDSADSILIATNNYILKPNGLSYSDIGFYSFPYWS